MSAPALFNASEPIREFKGEYRFLSNFWVGDAPLRVGHDTVGRNWPHPHRSEMTAWSVEHIYQACKVEWNDRGTTEVAQELQWVLSQPSPGDAKAAGGRRGKDGRKIVLRADWERVKVPVMLRCLRAKFADEQLGRSLMATSPRVLIEGNTWGDDYWGVLDRGNGRGKNMLGRLLMLVRAELLAATAAGIDVERLRA